MTTKSLKDALKKFDLRDGFVFGGLLFLGAGLWMFIPWVSLSTVGFLLFLVGMFTGKRIR